MQKDERLLPLPNAVAGGLQTPPQQESPANYSPFYDDDSIEQPRSIVEYLNVVYKRLPIILAMTVVTTAVVAFYMYRQPSMYEAKTEMVIEAPKPKMTNTTVFVNNGFDPNYLNTQLQLLQSPDLMRAVVIRLGLHRDPNLFSGQNRSFLSTLRTMVSGEKDTQSKENSLPVLTQQTATDLTTQNADEIVLTPEEKARADAYAGILGGGLKVSPVEKTNLVNIAVQSPNPELAARVADKTAEVFIDQYTDRSSEGSKKSLVELSKSIEVLKTTIDSQELERIEYLKNNNLPLGSSGTNFTEQKLTTVSGQWLAAADDRRKIEAKYEAAVRASSKGQGSSDPNFVENPIVREAIRQNTERKAKLIDEIRTIDKQIQASETKLSELRSKYTDEMPDNKIIISQIVKLKEIKETTDKEVSALIDKESKDIESKAVKGVVVGLKSQLEAAQGREAQLGTSYAHEIADANQQGQAETRLTTLTREIETNRTLYATLSQRQKEMELSATSGKPDNLSITNHAIKPNAPFGPNRSRNILIALMMSLSAGIGLAFLLDYLDDSVRTSDDIGRFLGLPTLAMIPHQNTVEKRKLSTVGGGASNTSLALVSLEDNRSAIAEAYRHLRTSLLFSSAGKPPQTILITSSQPSEGKTTTAINTAITLAQAGADVVIIDCDLRRPRLHNHFGLENGTGLTNYLSGGRNTDGLLKTFPGLPNLKVITSGPIPPNPAELLSSNEMKNLLQFLKGNYKHVIVDSPPAISFTDAAILATLVDGVILVAMAGKSSLHLIRRFKQRLSTIGARIYGVVLNGVKLNAVEYNYYGYGYAANYYNDFDESTPRLEEVLENAEVEKAEVEEAKG